MLSDFFQSSSMHAGVHGGGDPGKNLMVELENHRHCTLVTSDRLTIISVAFCHRMKKKQNKIYRCYSNFSSNMLWRWTTQGDFIVDHAHVVVDLEALQCGSIGRHNPQHG
jgi:hypothetical protein